MFLRPVNFGLVFFTDISCQAQVLASYPTSPLSSSFLQFQDMGTGLYKLELVFSRPLLRVLRVEKRDDRFTNPYY